MSFSPEIIQIGKLTLFIKENWDYQECLLFQEQCIQKVKDDSSKRFMLICSHPHLFTNGRGLQKGKNLKQFELQNFDNSRELPFPLHQIKRGGGLTFHYPGQFIVYPIVKLGPDIFSIKNILNSMMDLTEEVIQDLYQVTNLDHDRELLGIWAQDKKLASLGIATERYITYHGMAVNLNFDEKMLHALKSLYPCGIQPETYTDLASIIDNQPVIREKFQEEFINKISHSFWVK